MKITVTFLIMQLLNSIMIMVATGYNFAQSGGIFHLYWFAVGATIFCAISAIFIDCLINTMCGRINLVRQFVS